MQLELDGELAEVGLDEARIKRIPAYFDGFVETGRLAGWLATINRGGKLVWVGHGGHRDRERSLEVTDDTIWRLFSMTKPITAVAALMLYEEGKFDLNDEVSQWIDELREPRVYAGGSHLAMQTTPASEPVRVHHLFTHTAGFTYDFQYQSPVDMLYRAMGYDAMQWKFPDGRRPRGSGAPLVLGSRCSSSPAPRGTTRSPPRSWADLSRSGAGSAWTSSSRTGSSGPWE